METMPMKQIRFQAAIYEIFTTECDYVDDLDLIFEVKKRKRKRKRKKKKKKKSQCLYSPCGRRGSLNLNSFSLAAFLCPPEVDGQQHYEAAPC